MRRLRPAHATRLVAGLLGTFALTACARETPEPTPPAVQPTPPIFRDAASETGLDFQHVSGASGEHYLPEIMGPGVALVDYDVDGDLDVYRNNGDGSFADVTDHAGVDDGRWTTSASFFDYDRDGVKGGASGTVHLRPRRSRVVPAHWGLL